jgi:glycosyltransferase involved in cell wall biosynthesis
MKSRHDTIPVSVIVPAFNAAATIDETLSSLRAQTHEALEIVVVDDGSRDDTCERIERHAQADRRVRIVVKENGGVASARNRGALEARHELLTFVDADDLCAPTRIARLVEAIERGGPQVGLAYTWSARIDENSVVKAAFPREISAGDVFDALCRRNIVGNGSAAMMRRAAFVEAGGFDETLRARGAEGCEDHMIYLRIAESHNFAVVPEFLTGYRERAGSMSMNYARMLRSSRLVFDDLLARRPDLEEPARWGYCAAAETLAALAMRNGDLGAFARLVGAAFAVSPLVALRLLSWRIKRVLLRAPRQLNRLRSGPRRFLDDAL